MTIMVFVLIIGAIAFAVVYQDRESLLLYTREYGLEIKSLRTDVRVLAERLPPKEIFVTRVKSHANKTGLLMECLLKAESKMIGSVNFRNGHVTSHSCYFDIDTDHQFTDAWCPKTAREIVDNCVKTLPE